jgi:hypothetical protein
VTTHLKDAIADLVLRHGGAPKHLAEPAILRAARSLPDGMADLKGDKDYDAISIALARRLLRGDDLTARETRDGAWCLWERKAALAARPETLRPLLALLREQRNKRAARALALSYLIGFRADRPGLSEIAGTLRDLATVMDQPFVSLHDRYRIFDEIGGPRRVGDASLAERKSPRRILEEGGLRYEEALSGGFVEPCARRVLERAAGDGALQPAERLQLIELIAVKEGTRSDGRRDLAFPNHKALVANALLLPYVGDSLDDPTKDSILNFLVALHGVGDPRSQPANWVGMEQAREIAVGWLTKQALRQFLDVVEAVVPNVNWKYRRTFWEGIYDRGLIREAWVVLDREGSQEARRRFGRNTRFGQFMGGGGVLPGHAVLLLKIGKGVCAEWSYNGKCRFWDDAERTGAPKLYEASYDAEYLRTGRRYAPVLEIVHSPHVGPSAWQHKAANQIKVMSGSPLR